MEPQTIEEIRRAKEQLESNILQQLRDFQNTYSVHIGFIDLEHLDVSNAVVNKQIIHSLYICVEL